MERCKHAKRLVVSCALLKGRGSVADPDDVVMMMMLLLLVCQGNAEQRRWQKAG